jgi:hypothetical protein
MSGFSNFNTLKLDNSPFSDVISAMKRKSKNEIEQFQHFIDNLVNDVAFPLKDAVSEFDKKWKQMFGDMKDSISEIHITIDGFQRMMWKYQDTSDVLCQSVLKYINFKLQETEGSSTFFKKKLFNEIGMNLLVNEDKSTDLKDTWEEINDLIEIYLGKFEGFKKAYEENEAFRYQSIVDAINRIVIFETSCDMNNKYDTKGMAALVEKLDKDKYMEEISLDELGNINPMNFKPSNELKHLDQFDDVEDFDYEKPNEEIHYITFSILNAKDENEVNKFMNDSLHKFAEYFRFYKCRDWFIEIFQDRIDDKKLDLGKKWVFNAIVALFKRLLDEVFEQEDTYAGYQIISIIKEFFYTTEEEELTVYLQNHLRSQQIFGNYNFWEKYTLLCIRNEIRGTKLKYETKKEKQDLVNDLVFTKLWSVQEIILSFGLPKEIVKKIIVDSYWDAFKIDVEKRKILQDKIDFYGLTQEEIEELYTEKFIEREKRQSYGWFGGFGTSTLSRVGAMFTGSAEKPTRRSNSPTRDESLEDGEENKESAVNRSQHMKSSFVRSALGNNLTTITPIKGETNSDLVRDSSGIKLSDL